jgi:hypothetical protein
MGFHGTVIQCGVLTLVGQTGSHNQQLARFQLRSLGRRPTVGSLKGKQWELLSLLSDLARLSTCKRLRDERAQYICMIDGGKTPNLD